jgi:hypothetical protein
MTELITLDCYKEYRGKNSPINDGRIQSLIVKCSALIENYCNRRFTFHSTTPNAKVEWFPGKTNEVLLSEFPVLSIISVKTSSNGGITQTELLEAQTDMTGFFVDLDEGTVFMQSQTELFIDSYNTPYRSLEITYTAGYLDGELPGDLELAVIDLVKYYEEDESKSNKSLLGASITNPFPSPGESFPADIRRVLDLYRYSP